MKNILKLKWWEMIILALVLVLAGVAFAAFHETLTVSSTAKTLTASIYGTGAKKAFLSVEGNDIAWTVDGVTVPTTSGVGHILKTTDQGLWLENLWQIKNFKCIRASYRGDATLHVSYY